MSLSLLNKKPLFISFEGVDGSGKSTQIEMFAKWLADNGVNFIQTKEPGGGGEDSVKLREIAITGDKEKMDAVAELFIFCADRRIHMRNKVWPALDEQKISVICDRGPDSTTAYQAMAQSIDPETLEFMHNLTFHNRWPDITFILDIPYEVSLARKNEQAKREGLEETRFEGFGGDFHEKLRKAFQNIGSRHPERCIMIDASGSEGEIQEAIRQEFVSHLEHMDEAA